ncbi:MAG TPA: class I SAM-dependent methyltransferase [Bacteroidia bacterium]|nr:class I SAM-dependent methyltransferase [Bacteroidia bacterium]
MISILKRSLKLLLPKYQKLILEYRVKLKPRYTTSSPPPYLLELVEKGQSDYTAWIAKIRNYLPVFHAFKTNELEHNENEPAWNNNFLPGLDIVALYTIIAECKPALYIEVGSGNSTKVARRSIHDNKLRTIITSIDPFPRASIDHLADKVIREPFENLKDYGFITDGLNHGDILFIDNSHRCLPNSDVTVFFMEILPKLKKGVLVHVHDIYLPYDYPQEMCDRFYSEQYLLATALMANPQRYKIVFPAFYVSENAELAASLDDVWKGQYSSQAEKHGGSFWIEIG